MRWEKNLGDRKEQWDMGRLFDEHYIRNVKSMDGAWKFAVDEEDHGKDLAWYNGIPEGETVMVPSVWNTQRNMLTYEGVCWYEKSFYTDGGCIRLCFGAVMTEAEVWLDGEWLGTHYGGFCQFDFVVPDVAQGVHRVSVRVDNRFDAQSIPQTYVDWYHYGGIPRSVTCEELKGICVLNNKLEYELSDDFKTVIGTFTMELLNAEHTAISSHLRIKVGEEWVYDGNIEAKANERFTVTLPAFEMKDILLWDMEHPHLYDVEIVTDRDDLRDRVGFRKIAVEQEKILLNGKAIEIRGVNRHEEHPDYGFAFPQGLMKKEIDLAVEMGCNAIRGSHYPNSKEFVDFLDERGILFWSEIPIWGVGFSEEALADPVVVQRGLDMHGEMLKYYYNHPSIIFWGMHNEVMVNTQAGYAMSERYYGFLKENGGNRLVVHATDRPMTSTCFAFSDCICLNQYYGWYQGGMERWDTFLENFIPRRDEMGFRDKPILFSEFGCAALYGCHDDEHIPWSEEYQAKLIAYCIKLFHNHPSVAGGFIWQFCDIRCCRENGLDRARGFNNKGMLNEYRKPKRAYYEAQRLYREFANS